MKEEDMDKRKDLEARFGPDPADWPPPHAGLVAGGDLGRLHEALTVEGDETALTQAVLNRLARPKPQRLAPLAPLKVALAGYAGLWLALAVVGYQVMGGMLGDPILALALGAAPGWDVLQ
jgi:hypothetical protein